MKKQTRTFNRLPKAYSRKWGHVYDFPEKGKEKIKKGKIFANMGENVQHLKIFWKRGGDCVRLLHAINC